MGSYETLDEISFHLSEFLILFLVTVTGDAEWIYYELDDKHVQYMCLHGRIGKHLMHLHVHVYYREGIRVYVLS